VISSSRRDLRREALQDPPQLVLCLRLDLTDAFPGQAHRLTDLLEGERAAAVHPESFRDDGPLLLAQRAHGRPQEVLAFSVDQLLLGIHRVVVDEGVADRVALATGFVVQGDLHGLDHQGLVDPEDGALEP